MAQIIILYKLKTGVTREAYETWTRMTRGLRPKLENL